MKDAAHADNVRTKEGIIRNFPIIVMIVVTV
ncbi:TPA: hypothetical protein ACJWXN_001183 [Streptococcus pneumoniae]